MCVAKRPMKTCCAIDYVKKQKHIASQNKQKLYYPAL